MGDSGLEPALEASWSRLPRPGYGPFNSSSQNPGPSAWELRVRGPTWPRGPGSGEQGSLHKEPPESGALGFASRGQLWGLYSPPLFPQLHHLNPPLPDSLISCPRCPPQGQEFCLGPVPPQASGRVSPGLQRPEEGPPNAWVWSTEPPVSLPQALPAPLLTAVCRKSLVSPARGPLSTSPQPHPVLGAWPAQDPGAASRPVSMVARSREDPFIPAVGSAVPRSRSFCGQHSVKAQRSMDSLRRKPARSRPVGPLAASGDPGASSLVRQDSRLTSPAPSQEALCLCLGPALLLYPGQALSTPTWFVLEACPGHVRPSATAPEGLPFKKWCK